MTAYSGVPVYKLYGEESVWPAPDLLHVESIASRSRLHDWQIALHQHSGLFQILFLEQGRAIVRIDECEQEMQAGQAVLVPQLCVHGFSFEAGALGHVVMLAYPLFHKLAQDKDSPLAALDRPCLLAAEDEGERRFLAMAFAELDGEYRGNAPYRGAVLDTLLRAILLRLARHALAPTAGGDIDRRRARQHFARFSRLVDEYYAQHQPLTFYAGRLGIGTAHLNALCREVAGRSALALIHERMLLEAKRNLIYSATTVAVIADKLGFQDPAYFTRFFRRLTGLSPKAFRQEHAGRQ